MEPTIEQRLAHEQHHRWLQELHRRGDIDALLKAAVLLNTLYHQERIKVRWAIGEAAANLQRSIAPVDSASASPDASC
jgi:hypothetical protein